MMTDKNGVTMRTGDIVKVENAYFKNDNGFYFIDKAPGDVSWSGKDYCLHKIGKKGKISTARHTTAFWPLFCCCNDRSKNAAARKHNNENATIEIINYIDNAEIIEHFKTEAEQCREIGQDYKYRFGEDSETTKLEYEIADHLDAVAKRISK